MSILIAYKKGDTVYLGTDTRVTVNEHIKSEVCQSNHKIQMLNDGLIVGIAGDRLVRQTIFAYSEIFSLDKAGKLTRKHIAKVVIPKLIEVLERENLIVLEEDDVPRMKSQIVLAHKGDLFEICSNFAVYKYEDYQAIGISSDYAQSVLSSAKPTDDIHKTIIKALKVTAKNTYLVGAPYLLIDTKTKEYTLVRGENL